MPVPEQLAQRLAALAANTTSGASELLHEALDILITARAAGADVRDVARRVCEAQPSMAPMQNAAAAALSADPERLNVFAERVRRAPAALARYAAAHFADADAFRPKAEATEHIEKSRGFRLQAEDSTNEAGDFRLKAEATEHTQTRSPRGFRLEAEERALRVVTLSYSSSVLIVLKAIAAVHRLHVSCSESRPALEGRRLAADLAAAAIPVTCYGDAAIATSLDTADALIVGADAVSASAFLNKTGTRMLLATATERGVPSYVVATRDKFVNRELSERLTIRYGEPGEIWNAPPEGVAVQNPYFEWTPLEMITAVISDIGMLGAGMIPDVVSHATSAALRG